MYIGQLPAALRDIEDDGRSNSEILDALRKRHIALFLGTSFERSGEPIPPFGTSYNFHGLSVGDLPLGLRSSHERIFKAAHEQYGQLRKAPLRSALFLMERMERERLWADIFVMSEPAGDPDHPVFLTLGYEHDDGVPWMAAVSDHYTFDHTHELIVFLA